MKDEDLHDITVLTYFDVLKKIDESEEKYKPIGMAFHDIKYNIYEDMRKRIWETIRYYFAKRGDYKEGRESYNKIWALTALDLLKKYIEELKI